MKWNSHIFPPLSISGLHRHTQRTGGDHPFHIPPPFVPYHRAKGNWRYMRSKVKVIVVDTFFLSLSKLSQKLDLWIKGRWERERKEEEKKGGFLLKRTPHSPIWGESQKRTVFSATLAWNRCYYFKKSFTYRQRGREGNHFRDWERLILSVIVLFYLLSLLDIKTSNIGDIHSTWRKRLPRHRISTIHYTLFNSTRTREEIWERFVL